MSGPSEPMPADRPKVASLEQQIGELEKETQELTARIALAEQELARSEIRAPVSGRVVAVNVHGADAPIAPGTIELEIATADRPLLERLIDPVLRHKRSPRTVHSVADRGKPMRSAQHQGHRVQRGRRADRRCGSWRGGALLRVYPDRRPLQRALHQLDELRAGAGRRAC